MPRFTELIDKIGRNEPLTAGELGDLRRQGEAIDEVVSLVKSWITTGTSAPFIQNLRAENIFVPSGEIRLGTPAPGQGFSGVRIASPSIEYDGENWNIVGINNDTLQVGIRASDGKLIAGGNNVQLGQNGIDIIGDGDAWINFYNADGTVVLFSMSVDSVLGQFQFQATQPGDSLCFFIVLTDETAPSLFWGEDTGQANRTHLEVPTGAQGARLDIYGDMGIGQTPLIDLRTQGASGGSTFIRVRETTVTPESPSAGDAGHFYIKGDKFIIQFNDGGTTRYKSLDLTGTGVTWAHSTTPP